MDKIADGIREELLQVSIRLFLAKGYAGAPTMEIAKLAGVSKGALYYYFKSKEDIVDGIADKYRDEFVEGLRDRVNSCGGDFATKFRAFFKLSAEFARENKELLLVFTTLLIEFAGTGTEREGRLKEINEQYNMIIRKLIEEGIKDGSVPKSVDPATYARFTTNALMGSLLGWYLNMPAYEGDPELNRRQAVLQREALLNTVLSGGLLHTGDSAKGNVHSGKGGKV